MYIRTFIFRIIIKWNLMIIIKSLNKATFFPALMKSWLRTRSYGCIQKLYFLGVMDSCMKFDIIFYVIFGYTNMWMNKHIMGWVTFLKHYTYNKIKWLIFYSQHREFYAILHMQTLRDPSEIIREGAGSDARSIDLKVVPCTSHCATNIHVSRYEPDAKAVWIWHSSIQYVDSRRCRWVCPT